MCLKTRHQERIGLDNDYKWPIKVGHPLQSQLYKVAALLSCCVWFSISLINPMIHRNNFMKIAQNFNNLWGLMFKTYEDDRFGASTLLATVFKSCPRRSDFKQSFRMFAFQWCINYLCAIYTLINTSQFTCVIIVFHTPVIR